MRANRGMMAACAAGALMATAGLAQAQAGSASKPAAKSQAGMPLAPGQDQVLFRAKELVGKNVGTPQGQQLGKLEEIVFHPEVGIYGLVAMEEDDSKFTPVPWALVTAVTDRAIVVNTTKETLASAPSIAEKQWAQFNKAEFTDKIDSHFGAQMGGAGQTGSGGSSSGASAEPQPSSGASSATDTNAASATDTNTPSGGAENE